MKRDLYFFSGTHWDREWYKTFQGFRYQLVKMLDGVIEAWDKEPRFGVFHLDGQTSPLEDYAEISPENTDKLKALISEGKVKVGPWFVMPDEFNVSGESLIRNLMLGHELAKKWGADDAWKFGYICDVFGHVAQTPQIFRGFDINYSLFSRGYFSDLEPYFVWRSPDGSEVLNMRIGNRNGYCDFTMGVPEHAWVERSFEESLEFLPDYLEYLTATTKHPVHLLMDATDHHFLRLDTPRYIDEIKKLYPDAEVHHTDLIEAGKKLEAYHAELDTVTGEMNYSNRVGFPDLITNVLSSYYPLKKHNDECQNRLEKVIEPMLANASMSGKPMNRSFVKRAYRYLLLNHPHDSIGGCSIDQVHKDMEYRYDQVTEICDTLEEDYFYTFGRKQGYTADALTDGVLTFTNTLPFDRDEVVTVPLYMKPGYKPQYSDQAFGYELINCFRIIDSEGTEIPYRVVSIRRDMVKTLFGQKKQIFDVYNVTFLVTVPAGGTSEYRIVPSEKPSRYLKYMISGADYMENELLRADIAPDGSLTLTDKVTGRQYADQLTLADDAEIGDGWYHANPREDRTVYSRSGRCRIEKIEEGCSRCVFRITKEIEVPDSMFSGIHAQHRSDSYTVCTAVFEVGLSDGARFADVSLTYKNTAKDHRVRLAVPTKTEVDSYFSSQAFYSPVRRVGIDYSTEDWREYDQYEKSMSGIVGKRDSDGYGLALVSPAGLHECAALDDEDATIYVTLLRGFRKTVLTNGEVRGQLLGEHSYRFALVPLDSTVDYAELTKLQSRLAVPLMTRYVEIEKTLPIADPVSGLRVGGEGICLSVFKCAEREDNAYILRLFNASNAPSEAVCEFPKPVASAVFVNLNEEPSEDKPMRIDGGKLCFDVSPWRIETILVRFK